MPRTSTVLVDLYPFTQHLSNHKLLSPLALHSSLVPSSHPPPWCPSKPLGCAFPNDLTHDPQDSVSLLCDFVHGHLIYGDGQGPVTSSSAQKILESFLSFPMSKEALPEGETSESRGLWTEVTVEGHSWEATCCPVWGLGVTIAGLIPGCLDLPKAKFEKFQEVSQPFHWTSIWRQSRARRLDKSWAGRRQRTQAWAAARKAPPSASIHMRPNAGCWKGAGPT